MWVWESIFSIQGRPIPKYRQIFRNIQYGADIKHQVSNIKFQINLKSQISNSNPDPAIWLTGQLATGNNKKDALIMRPL
jgi:hypothetical protein